MPGVRADTPVEYLHTEAGHRVHEVLNPLRIHHMTQCIRCSVFGHGRTPNVLPVTNSSPVLDVARPRRLSDFAGTAATRAVARLGLVIDVVRLLTCPVAHGTVLLFAVLAHHVLPRGLSGWSSQTDGPVRVTVTP